MNTVMAYFRLAKILALFIIVIVVIAYGLGFIFNNIVKDYPPNVESGVPKNTMTSGRDTPRLYVNVQYGDRCYIAQPPESGMQCFFTVTPVSR